MGQKSAGSQTTTQQPDALTQQWRKLIFSQGLGALGLPGIPGTTTSFMGMNIPNNNGIGASGPKLQPVPGVSPLTTQGIGGYQNALAAGNLGLGALTGNQTDLNAFMNPFQSNVLDQVKSQYGDLANLTTNNVNDQATQAGAFGGTRHGVAEGVALGQLDKGLGQQLAGLQYQGFNDAMGRAGATANLGLGAAGQLAQLGDYQRQVQMQQDPAMRNLQILQGLLSGTPFGSSTSTPLTKNPLMSGLGGAATGFSFGGPIGAGIGGLIGLLGG